MSNQMTFSSLHFAVLNALNHLTMDGAKVDLTAPFAELAKVDFKRHKEDDALPYATVHFPVRQKGKRKDEMAHLTVWDHREESGVGNWEANCYVL